MIIIKDSFTREEAKKAGDAICVTPQSFSQVKDWKGQEVEGVEYYVKKAVELGAVAKKKTRKAKPPKVETLEITDETTEEAGD